MLIFNDFVNFFSHEMTTKIMSTICSMFSNQITNRKQKLNAINKIRYKKVEIFEFKKG